jgi:hypothetical protein
MIFKEIGNRKNVEVICHYFMISCMASSERQILSDIGNRYCFWIWAQLLAVAPLSKKPTSSEQIDGAKHRQISKF